MLSPLHNQNPTNVNGKPPRTVTGEFIAKATTNYQPWQRAQDAARWLRGELHIKPTAKQAAEIFGVSLPLVAKAREWLELLEQRRRSATNGNGVSTLSDSAVENIVREVGVDRIWRAVDKLTQPTLPLMTAAE
jgi:hypothetical protein